MQQPWPDSRNRSVVTEIVPRLFISDLTMAENPAVLASFGITHVLSVMPGFIALPSDPPLHHAQIPLEDLPFVELVAHLPGTTAFIANALRHHSARVLVHCGEGISRSPTIVCAYLIAQYGLTPAQAVQFVKSRRRVADPNPGFVAQLYEYAEAVRRASSAGVAPPPS
jgi:atypical dual specificity phosphatase